MSSSSAKPIQRYSCHRMLLACSAQSSTLDDVTSATHLIAAQTEAGVPHGHRPDSKPSATCFPSPKQVQQAPCSSGVLLSQRGIACYGWYLHNRLEDEPFGFACQQGSRLAEQLSGHAAVGLSQAQSAVACSALAAVVARMTGNWGRGLVQSPQRVQAMVRRMESWQDPGWGGKSTGTRYMQRSWQTWRNTAMRGSSGLPLCALFPPTAINT